MIVTTMLTRAEERFARLTFVSVLYDATESSAAVSVA
jgi:hypothetical protein